MHSKQSIKQLLRKILTIFLIVTLVLGVLSSFFGIAVVATNNKPSAEETVATPEGNTENKKTEGNETTVEYPTKNYTDLNNEMDVNDDVIMLDETQSNEILSSITSIQTESTYRGNNLVINMAGEDIPALENVSYGDIIYIADGANSPLGGARFLKVDDIYSYDDETIMRTSEPYFEDVFESMEMCVSDLLTEENFVDAYYMDGVTSHFGDADKEILNVSKSGTFGDAEVQTLGLKAEEPKVINTANQYSTSDGDLIITLDVDLGEDEDKEEETKDNVDEKKDDVDEKKDDVDENKEDEKKDDDDFFEADASCKLSGQIGIKDLAAHVVCDMPSVAQFNELYIGVSGQFFADVHFSGKLGAKAESAATEKDWKYLSIEGLNEKLFTIAAFQFQGVTPIYITNSVYETTKEAVYPTLYFIVYSDWEGEISVELTAGFTYAHSFNNGLRIIEDGDPCLRFENYPYTQAYDVESEDGATWDIKLAFDAESDITLVGGSVVFYVAGINIGELSVARLGLQTKANAEITASKKDGEKVLSKGDTEFYIRGYLKLLEFKLKLKLEGKQFLKSLSLDSEFEFALLDMTLFEIGDAPDQYKPKVPISSIVPPTEFSSVISVVFDVSGSMNDRIDTGETKLEAAKSASKVIVDTTEKWSQKYTDDAFGIGVIQFSDSAQTVCVPHIDYKFIKESIDTMYDGGGTSIHSGIDTAISQLESVTSKDKIIILMTDGQDGSSSTMESARQAAEKGIKIYTVGFGNDVDEALLQEIADTTNGEYRFADTENLMGIVGSFMYTQQASTSTVLTEVEGTVSQGETTTAKNFVVKDKNGNLHVTTAWPGSFLDTILIDPTGRVVDENYPGAVTDESSIPSTITVTNPISGKWKVKIKGVETSYDKEPYYTIVSFKSTEENMINEVMSDLEHAAAYCLPIGIYLTVVSALLLICLGKKKTQDNTSEFQTDK